MRITISVLVLGMCGLLILPLYAEYLHNANLENGLAGWQGDGEAAYLKPDGTEGADTDTGAIPVLKLPLSQGQPHLIYQNCDMQDKPTTLHIRVDVFASTDFKRSQFPEDYTPNITWKPGWIYNLSMQVTPNVDFWIRGGPGPIWFYKLSNLKPGAWVPVDVTFDSLNPVDNREIDFCVPRGTGTIYLKNPSVNP